MEEPLMSLGLVQKKFPHKFFSIGLALEISGEKFSLSTE